MGRGIVSVCEGEPRKKEERLGQRWDDEVSGSHPRAVFGGPWASTQANKPPLHSISYTHLLEPRAAFTLRLHGGQEHWGWGERASSQFSVLKNEVNGDGFQRHEKYGGKSNIERNTVSSHVRLFTRGSPLMCER